jgi:hypothetical protein
MVPGILVFRWVTVPNPEPAHAKLLAFFEGEDIATVYVGNAKFHAHLAEEIRDEVGKGTLLAAANMNKHGEITSWESSGFSFVTPLDVRDAVALLVREHAKEIEDYWTRG